MRSPALHLAGPEDAPRVETVAERVRRLSAEARSLARDHVSAFEQAMSDLQAMAEEINRGGGAYPEGARAVARDQARQLECGGKTLAAIMGRS